MALQFLEDFGSDSKTNVLLGGRLDANNDTIITFSSSTGPFNDGAATWAYSSSAKNTLTKSLGVNYSTFYTGLWINFSQFLTVNRGDQELDVEIFTFYDGGTAQLSIATHFNTNQITVWKGAVQSASTTNLLGTSSFSFGPGRWYFLELAVVIATGTSGSVNCKVGGVSVLNLTGINTAPSGLAQVNQIQLGYQEVSGNARATGNVIMSSWYFADNSAGNVTGNIGPYAILYLKPTGPGVNTQFTPLAANNWTEVSQNPSTGDASYNSATGIGNTDLFVHATVNTSYTTIYGVCVDTLCRIDIAGLRGAQAVLYDGANTGNVGSVGTVGPTYSWLQNVREFKVGNNSVVMDNTYVSSNLQFGYIIST